MLFLIILVVSFLLQLFLPWWIIAPVAFGCAAWRGRSNWRAFGAGFAGIAVGWLLLSAFIHVRTEGILTEKVAVLFSLPHSVWLLLITALVGGLVGGVAAWAGYSCRQLF